MRRSLLTVRVALGLKATWSIGRLQGQAQGNKVIFVSSSHANFSEMQGGKGGVSTAPIRGDASAGAHGTFTKFVPGYDAGTACRAAICGQDRSQALRADCECLAGSETGL